MHCQRKSPLRRMPQAWHALWLIMIRRRKQPQVMRPSGRGLRPAPGLARGQSESGNVYTSSRSLREPSTTHTHTNAKRGNY